MGTKDTPILSALSRLFYSRKFLLMLLDTAVSLTLHYYGGDNTQFIITAIQPVIVALIVAISIEDAAAKHR